MSALRVTAVALREGGAPIPTISDVVTEQSLWLLVSVDLGGAPVTGLGDAHFSIRIVHGVPSVITPVALTMTNDDGDIEIVPMVSSIGLDGFYAVRCWRPPNTFWSSGDHAVQVSVTDSSGARGQAVAAMPWPRELLGLSALADRLEDAKKTLKEIASRVGVANQ